MKLRKIIAGAAIATALTGTTSQIGHAASLIPRPLSEDTTGFKDILPDIQRLFVNPEGKPIDNPEAVQLDPLKLSLSMDAEVFAFFINEGAAKRNQLDYFTTSGTPGSGRIFEDISCKNGCEISEPNGNLNIGNWVNLGSFAKGTQFDLRLRAKNDNDGQIDTYGANPLSNPDGLAHLVAYSYKGYVIAGFEDLLGSKGATGGRNEQSDRDFNDVLVAFKMPVDVNNAAVPEPTTMAGLAIAGGVGAYLKRRQKRQPKGE
jgi:PEP-CTERM motif